MKTIFICILSWVFLVFAPPARSNEVLFYQPLNVDSALTLKEWNTIWKESRHHGAQKIIVQWTRHGQSDFAGADGWLIHALRAAHAQGLELILGLSYDPDYYQHLRDATVIPYHWHQWLAHSLQQQQWLLKNADVPISGWYIPMELDDANYASPVLQKEISHQLAVFASHATQPLHISAFSAGKLSPKVYAAWLDALHNVAQVWWQDGAGTGSMHATVRAAYESALPCKIGIVREAFRAINLPEAAFRAESAQPHIDPTSCHAQAIFSLRYLPWAKVLLQNQRAAEAAAQ